MTCTHQQHSTGTDLYCKDCMIAALRGEVERLREERELCIEERNVVIDSVMAKSNELSQLRTALSRYREAVEWVLGLQYHDADTFKDELRRRAGREEK